ncbi:MAG: Gfo/Idh/MocA family oxidoreductase [Candidatus Poribacteria bacterium]|nr:Gfo/Idh/MocA family oxidoreductase [Candidatus Poribacteria bacterium]MDE0506879.1 Gfo/Idh/MocA family oxidoreductase [Candidatus Poribacteria bacterium]
MTERKENVRWGILSTARIASKVSRAIKLASNAELVAIASRTKARAETWAAEHGVERAYGTYEQLLEDESIDAIYLPTPPTLHAEWTIKAAECGIHVLCEKPLAANVEESVEMANACSTNGVQLMDGVMWVHHNRTPQMRQIIDDGTLGKLRRVTSAFSLNWDAIPYDNIRAKKELAGGSLGDLGYYCVRAILWAFGDLPTQVFATARYEVGVDMNFSGLLWFDGGRMATFDSAFDTGSRKWFEIAGTDASLVCDDFVIPWNETSARFWIHSTTGKDAEHNVENTIQEVNMIEHFSNIVKTGTLEPRLAEDAINTMIVCEALSESARRNEIVELKLPNRS